MKQVEHKYRADRENNIRAYLHNAIEQAYRALDEFEEHGNATPLFDATVELIQVLVREGLYKD